MIDPDELKALPLFSDLAAEELTAFAAHARRRTAAVGTSLLTDGQPADPVMAIESGTAWVLRHEHRVGELSAGDIIVGDPLHLGPRLANASVIAATSVRLIVLSDSAAERLRASGNGALKRLLRSLAERREEHIRRRPGA
jgi:CRP-like cAMP-binding protein